LYPTPGNATTGLLISGGVAHVESSDSRRKAGFSNDGSEFLYGV